MLCQKCHERQATIHLSTIVGDKMTKMDLCEVCGNEHMFLPKGMPLESSATCSTGMLAVVPSNDPRAKETCEHCHERPVKLRFCQRVGDEETDMYLCEVCAKEHWDPKLMPYATWPWEMMLAPIVTNDPRYAKEAYVFLQEGLERAREMYRGLGVGHVSGAQLLEALRVLALETYGKQAKATLNGWGICKCEDFGEMVFNLVEAGLMARQETDSKADFHGGYDFDTAFPTS